MEKQEKVYQIFQKIALNYDGANKRISMGLQKYWKHQLVDCALMHMTSGGKILDCCCGTGDIAIDLARRRKNVFVTGVDFSPAMLKIAEKRKKGLLNIKFSRENILDLPFEKETFDAVLISFGLRNTADYEMAIKEMKRVLKQGGYFYCLDSYVPDSRLISPFYQIYFKLIMPFIGGGHQFKKEYQWLWKSTQSFVNKYQLASMLKNNGFLEVKIKSFLFGSCVLHCGKKKYNLLDAEK